MLKCALFQKLQKSRMCANYYHKDRPSQSACTVMTVHITCTVTALRVHENSCTVLIPRCKNNLNLPISHTDHYALRKQDQPLPQRF